MTRHHAGRPAEHDAKGPVGGRAPQLAVHKVGAAAEEQAHRCGNGAQIGQREKRDTRYTGSYGAADEQPHETAMEAHAPLVERKDLQRMGQVVAVAVEQHVSDARTQHHADDGADHEREQVVLAHAELPALRYEVDDGGGADEPEHVGQAVPAHHQRPQREGNGVKPLINVVQHYDVPSWAPMPAPSSMAANTTSSRNSGGMVRSAEMRAAQWGQVSVNSARSARRAMSES